MRKWGEGDTLKKQVLFAAMKEFAEKGYLGASLGDIGKRCNTSSALVCYHFNTKANLAQAVIDTLAQAVRIPKAVDIKLISSESVYRAALKKFISDFIDVFMSQDEPICYIAPLYRHEAADPGAKLESLHDTILWPVFLELEKLISHGVPDRNPIKVRFWALAVWNVLLGYALKDTTRVSKYFPNGMPKERFRPAAIDFIVNDVLAPLKFTPQA